MQGGQTGPTKTVNIFVGRQPELSRLRSALDEAASSRGQVIMLTGEPGIGKTTLAETLASEAASRGSTTLFGACFDGEYSPPFWLWTQVIRSALDTEHGENALSQLTKRQQFAISRIVPELEISDTEDETTAPHDERGRFELYDSVARFLVHLSSLAPAVIWLDDLHWADDSDLAFLEFASQQLATSPIMVLGTYRDTDVARSTPLARTLGLLTRMRGFDRIRLAGLAPSEMAELIRRAATVRLDAAESNRLVERAAGNPLFGREMARGIADSGLDPAAEHRLPEGITEAIGRRMAGLSDSQLKVLQTAAVFGPEFTVADIAASAEEDGPVEATELALEAARNSGLVEELASSPGTYRFTHALIQETLYDELTPTQLVRTHARIAKTLVAGPGKSASDRLSAIARHHREGVLLLDLDEAIEYSLLAGDHALATYSFSEAADHFEWAAESAEDKSDSPERAHVLERLAVATERGNARDPQHGWDTLCEAVRMYIRLGLNEDAVRLASFPAVIGGMTGVVELIEDALKVAIPGTIERGWLLARYVTSLGDAARPDEAEVAFAETIEIAAEHENERLRARALVHGAQVWYRANDPERCVTRGLEAIEIALRLNEALSVLRVIDFCTESLCATGRGRDALELIERCRDVRDETTDSFSHLNRARYIISLYRGDWNRIDSILADLPNSDRKSNLVNWHAALKGLRLGMPDTGLYEMLDPSISKYAFFDGYHIAINILATWLQVQSDRKLLELCDQIYYTDPVVTAEGKIRLRGLSVLRSLQHGTTPETEDITALRDSSSRVIPRTDVPLERILGAVSVAAGELTEAREHVKKAIEFCRDGELWPSLAWSLLDLIRLAVHSPETVGRDAAEAAASEALKLCDQLEMPVLATKIGEALERLPVEHSGHAGSNGSAAYPDGLSEREVEVLRLLSDGKSNQDIADQLFISRYTVVRHVSNIFQKSGASNRTEAASYAHQHNLV